MNNNFLYRADEKKANFLNSGTADFNFFTINALAQSMAFNNFRMFRKLVTNNKFLYTAGVKKEFFFNFVTADFHFFTVTLLILISSQKLLSRACPPDVPRMFLRLQEMLTTKSFCMRSIRRWVVRILSV
jgi:hypothetical protein